MSKSDCTTHSEGSNFRGCYLLTHSSFDPFSRTVCNIALLTEALGHQMSRI
jgi:hypothetical protein